MLAALLALAAQQHGLVTWIDFRNATVSRSTLHGYVRRGLFGRVCRGVYRAAGAPVTWEQRVLAAVLGAGAHAVASHRTAAALWKLDGIMGKVVEVTVPRGRGKLKGVVTHETRTVPTGVTVAGIPVTSAARTLVDLAAVVPHRVLLLALDDALRRRLTTIPALERELRVMGTRGRRGVVVLQRVIEEQRGQPFLGSKLERHFHEELRTTGLPKLLRQFRVMDGPTFIAQPDFSYPDRGIVVEIDGGGHLKPRARQLDGMRQNKLELRGWLVLRYTRADLEERMNEVVEEIRTAYLTRAGWGRGMV